MGKDWWKEYLSEDGKKLDLSYLDINTLSGIHLPDNLQEIDLCYSSLQSLNNIDFPESLEKALRYF